MKDLTQEIKTAQNKAVETLDAWNDVTGALNGSYYYEARGIVEDAAKMGVLIAWGIEFSIVDGEIVRQ